MIYNPDDTICAIATAPSGAIGIVRISGRQAIQLATRLFSRDLTQLSAGKAVYGHLSQTDGTAIDDAIATVFRAPHSYTGEDSVELSCHGSPYILQQVCSELINLGARQAEPGEYTRRAFMNGKLDLAQAEAVADLIATRTRAQHSMALSALRGQFSDEINSLHDKLQKLTALMELELDFADHEDLEFADRTELKQLCSEVLEKVTKLTDSYRTGNAIKEGVRVAIVGATNAGKSTLINQILHEERAIVSDIHGTTRDTIEETQVWQGITFRFIDTAGLRQTSDQVERIGIERTHRAIEEAHIILYVVDATQPTALTASPGTKETPTALTASPRTKETPTALLLNKSDLCKQQLSLDTQLPTFTISAKTGDGLQDVQQWVVSAARESLHLDASDIVVANERHYRALLAAGKALQSVQSGLRTSLPTDLLTQDLHEALSHLAEVTCRQITPETTLQYVFQHFCIGK